MSEHENIFCMPRLAGLDAPAVLNHVIGYLRELVRNIHLNLLRAGWMEDMRELNRSPWSGHLALMGYVKREWHDTDYVRSFFGRGREGRRRYQEFVSGGIDKGRRPELVGGGLIRSAGGWFEVLALRRSGDRQASDQRILGDGELVCKGGRRFRRFVALSALPGLSS